MSVAALCVATVAATVTLPARRFTLVWQHTVEKTLWEEDYLVAGDWLFLAGARIRGSGAGMEPPEGAVLQRGVWHYRPASPWRREVVLANSEFAGEYTLCLDHACKRLNAYLPARGQPVTLRPCRLPQEDAR
jgi:hypothetical protein